MYILSKLSSPSWEEEFSSPEDLVVRLEQCICPNCMVHTKEDLELYFTSKDNPLTGTELEETVQFELDYCCLSTDYDSMSILDKVDALMGTACGCEYDLEEK